MIDPTQPDYTNTPVSSQRPRFGYIPFDPTTPPCVTIITPFYRPGPVFHETACSVLQQSLQQWEWIIINDGSTDAESLAILEAYRDQDPRIRVIDHGTNKGLSATRNAGFLAAQTPYVVQLDSDDLLEPTAVEKWFWFLQSYPEFAFVKGYSVGFGAEQYIWQRGFHDGRAFLETNLVAPTSMIRKSVHDSVGGYDEAIRGGLEDWDFWLHCASCGYWGGTTPEYLDWYRRRPAHNDRWMNWDKGERQQAFHARLHQRYGRLWEGRFPQIASCLHLPYNPMPDTLPGENRLRKNKPRLLLALPWLSIGGADKFNLDILEQMTRRGWEITIVATLGESHMWLPHFARFTPDIFILRHFLRLADYPRFLRYLIQSRQIDVVMITHSEFSYLLLPYLRAYCPEVSFVDFCHIEEEQWKNGGYPRMAVDYQELLDLNIVSSEHLQQWMIREGAESQRISVCYTNVDADRWRPDPDQRIAVRKELGLNATVPLILYAGRVCVQKQPQVFAQTILQLCQRNLDFMALVVGDGPELGRLRALVDEYRLHDRIRLLGAVNNERVRELLTAADIFFLPSVWEGIALAIYEAMACGLPVVAADVGGQRELVTPECGILIVPGDEKSQADQYAEALSELLRNPGDRQRMGQNGRTRVQQHFRLETMAEKLILLLQEAIRLHVTQPRPVPSRGLGRACAVQARVVQEQMMRIEEIERGKVWMEEQRSWIGELEKGKAWLEEQWAVWQRLAEEREKIVQEQRSWIGELEKGKTWVEEQWAVWQRLAEEREKIVQEQRSWIGELEKGKAWLQEQWAYWQQIAEERERTLREQEDLIQTWKKSVWGRVGVRSGILRRPSVTDGN